MNGFIQVKSVGENVYYKVKVLGADWHDPTLQKARFADTINHKMTMSFGKSKQAYRGFAKLSATPEVGYVTLAKFREWARSDFFSYRQLWLIDHDAGPAVAVFLVTDVDPEYLTAMKDPIYVPFEFRQRA